MFTSFLGGTAPASRSCRPPTAPRPIRYTGSVAVANETFAVALQSANQVFHPDAAAFSSQVSAQNYLASAVASDPSLTGTLHVIPQFEVAA